MNEPNLKNLEIGLKEMERVNDKLSNQNEVLKHLFAKEYQRRESLECYNRALIEECKSLKDVIYRIQEELGVASRKEELVRSLRQILSDIQF